MYNFKVARPTMPANVSPVAQPIEDGDDPLAPARGILIGLLISITIWACFGILILYLVS